MLPRLPLLVRLAVLTAFITGCGIAADTEPSRTVLADTAADGVPMRLVGPGGAALMVSAVVNGESLDLVLDTGATLTCLDRSVAERLELEPYRGARGVGVGVQGRGETELVRIDSLSFGGATAYDVMGCTLDLQHLDVVGTRVDGLLGLNVLKEFRVVLDFPNEVVRLESPAPGGAPASGPAPDP